MIIIGKKCPPFNSPIIWNSEMTRISLDDLRGHYTLLFFYSLDFSAVCPTEIVALQKNIELFNKRNVDIIAISTDSIYIHAAWLRTAHEEGGIVGTTFKILSDETQELTRAFGIFDEVKAMALRGSFLIDENLIVQYGSVNNTAFGRSVTETLRVIDAVQYAATHGQVCPANWKAGDKGINEHF